MMERVSFLLRAPAKWRVVVDQTARGSGAPDRLWRRATSLRIPPRHGCPVRQAAPDSLDETLPRMVRSDDEAFRRGVDGSTAPAAGMKASDLPYSGKFGGFETAPRSADHPPGRATGQSARLQPVPRRGPPRGTCRDRICRYSPADARQALRSGTEPPPALFADGCMPRQAGEITLRNTVQPSGRRCVSMSSRPHIQDMKFDSFAGEYPGIFTMADGIADLCLLARIEYLDLTTAEGPEMATPRAKVWVATKGN